MEFYRAEFLIENLKKHSEEENKQRKKEEEKYAEDSAKRPNTASMMAEAKRTMPTPSFKMPSGFGKISF